MIGIIYVCFSHSLKNQVYKLDEITASQRNVVYSQRRAFLTSTDEGWWHPYSYLFGCLAGLIAFETNIFILLHFLLGMIETFTRYCMQTMDEIYDASLLTPSKFPGKGMR